MATERAKRRKLSRSSNEPEVVKSDVDEVESESGSETSQRESRTNGQGGVKVPTVMASKAAPDGVSEHRNRVQNHASTEQIMGSSAAGLPSMMNLQIDDLLRDIRPDYEKLTSRLEKTLLRLRQIIQELPDVGPMTVSEAEKALRKEGGVRIPFPNPRPSKDSKYTFAYKRPTSVDVGGSLPLQFVLKSKDICTVDLSITIPDSVLQEKDFLNRRYFSKRAYYLAQIAAGIRRNAKNVFKLSFEYQDNITLKPALIVEPTHFSPHGFQKSNLRVRIITAISPEIFPGNKTLPGKCCLRASDETSPTPFYNACVRSEATVHLYQKLLQTTISHCDAFRDVCLLGRLWLRQRGFDESVSRGGFGSFEWSIVCALLLKSGGAKGRPALSPRYTCLQIFKAILQFLAARDLTDPLVVNGATDKITQSGYPVLFDDEAQINVLYKMTPWSYQLLRQEARSTIEAFRSKVTENFELIFIKRLDEDLLRFDQSIVLGVKAFLHNQQEEDNLREYLQKLHDVLSTALGNRVRLIHISHDPSPLWTVDKPLDSASQVDDMIKIGLQLDAENADRLVDHGPSAEDQVGAANFRKFWGDKAELRRFKDGSITESLVWSGDTPVIQQIILYILERHFHLSLNAIDFLGGQVEHVLPTHNSLIPRKSAYKLVNDAFQSLTTQLRQLEGLPLSIRSILPASSQLRYASLQTPLVSHPLYPIDIIIEFEGSARWPDSLPAIQRTKIAFLIKLGDLLSASDSSITTQVGLEDATDATSKFCNSSYLDIMLPSPSSHLIAAIPFRLRIHHDRTLTLLQNALLSTSDRTPLTAALHSYTRHYLAIPTHTTTISRLCTLHPTLPATIHLLKSWTSSHHLTNLVPEEILEILAARPYLQPYPWSSPPSSAQTAFLRSLTFIADWDGFNEPLILDLSNNDDNASTMTKPQIVNLQTRFQAWRKQLDPGLNNVVWFVGTNIDETGVVWTQGQRPPRVVAARFTALARASIDLVKHRNKPELEMKEDKVGFWKSMFQSPLADFDFLIHLNKHAVSAHQNQKPGDSKFKNLQLQLQSPISTIETIGFDPVHLFLQDLQHVFADSILFFYGSNGNRVIPCLWNPRVLPGSQDSKGRGRGREWKVKMGYSTIPIPVESEDQEGEKVEGIINQRGILAEIEMLGEGLVERIEVLRPLVVE